MFLGVGFAATVVYGHQGRGFFFHAPPKEQVADPVIAAFAWSYCRVVELPKGQTTDLDTSRVSELQSGTLPFKTYRDSPSL